jgi:hypothetical protein
MLNTILCLYTILKKTKDIITKKTSRIEMKEVIFTNPSMLKAV